MKTKYLFPIISLGPPFGYEMDFNFALDQVIRHIDNRKCKVLLSRYHYFKGKKIKSTSKEINFDGKKWLNRRNSEYSCNSIYKSEKSWNSSIDIEYIETHLEMLSDNYFYNIHNFQHLYYTIFSSKYKTFLSDNSFKYGAVRVIDQIEAFDKWTEGYPDCNISRLKNIDESIIIINPFSTKVRVKVSLFGKKTLNKYLSIEACSGKKIKLSDILDKKIDTWSGQILISGKNRLIIFFLKHSYLRPALITSLEHSEHFRGEHTHKNLLFYFKNSKYFLNKIFKIFK